MAQTKNDVKIEELEKRLHALEARVRVLTAAVSIM